MVTHIVQGICCGESRYGLQIRNRLNPQTAGNDNNIFRSLGNDPGKLLCSLHLIAKEVHVYRAGDMFSLLMRKGSKVTAFRFYGGVELLEALIAGNNEEIVLLREDAFQFFFAL